MFEGFDTAFGQREVNGAAAFGAGVGGADAVTVLPYDGSDSALARRNARNIQHLLIDESGINRLVDPAAGSGFADGGLSMTAGSRPKDASRVSVSPGERMSARSITFSSSRTLPGQG